MLDWAWGQADMQDAVRDAYRRDHQDTSALQQPFFDTVDAWLKGSRFQDIAPISKLDLNDLLNVHSRIVSYVLQTLIEQGVALLAKLVESHGKALAPAVVAFPEHLRFGVPTTAARLLAGGGIRHRSAAVELGNALTARGVAERPKTVLARAQDSLRAYPEEWKARLGTLVFRNTIADLASVFGGGEEAL